MGRIQKIEGRLSKGSIKTKDIVTLISYLVIIIGFLSIVRHIHVSYLVFFLMLFVLSIYFEVRSYFLPRWLLNLLSLFIVFIAFLRIDRDNLVTTVVETLLILSAIKLIEEKKPRDHLQIYIISVFLIAGSALLTLNISFVFYFALFTFIFPSGIVMLTYLSESENLEMKPRVMTSILLRSLIFPILAIPLTVIFFTFLPRTNYPFLNFLNREVARSGFTDSVKLGHVSEIQEDARTVFRVSMERIADNELYWRGIVLDYFDGLSWNVTERDAEGDGLTLKGRGIKQTIYLEPYENRYLFALDKPFYMSIKKAKVSKEIVFALPENISRKVRYEAYSVPSDVIPEKDVVRHRYLQLPEKDLTRLKTFVRGFEDKDDEDLARSIMDYLKKHYSYSLTKLPVSDNPVEDFLFNRKSGNCEYFASTMAVLLRLKGIPSRLVGGYRGGLYNEVGGYYLISQRDAHVWVEVYLDGKGWVRFDPTPAVPGEFINKRGILFKTRLIIDTINYYWNAFVITYDLSKQISLFNKARNIKMPALELGFRKEILIRIFATLVILVVLGMIIYRKVSSIKTPEVAILCKFLNIMKIKGYIKKNSQGLEEFALSIKEPQLREKALFFVKEIEPYLFGSGLIDRRARNRLMKIIKDIK